MRRFHTLAAAASIVAAAALAPALAQQRQPQQPAQQEIRITVISHGQANDPFWSVVRNGAARAAEDMRVRVDYRAPETFDMVRMGQLIDAAVNQRPTGLIVSIPDASALGPAIRRAVAAGIPVISMNSGSDVSRSLGALLHVGQDEQTAGRIAGARLKELGGRNAICVNHEVGNVSLDLRCRGFTEGFGGRVTVLPVGNDPTEIRSKVTAALAADRTIDTILALGAPLSGEPTVAAVRAAGRTDVRVASFDLSANFLRAVAEGQAAFAIDQQQYLQGYLPVVFLALQARYGLVPGGDVPSGPNLVGREQAARVVELSSRGIR